MSEDVPPDWRQHAWSGPRDRRIARNDGRSLGSRDVFGHFQHGKCVECVPVVGVDIGKRRSSLVRWSRASGQRRDDPV
jgi:hypothetical protein